MSAHWQALIANLAVVAVVVTGWTLVQDWLENWSRPQRNFAFALLMGAGAVTLMLLPFELRTGVNFDLRTSLIAIAGFFGGPLAAVVAGTMAILYRLAAGGAGALAGTLGISIAAITGLAAHVLLRGRAPTRTTLVVFAGATAALSLVSFAALPAPIVVASLLQVGPPVVSLIFVATLMAGFTILQEARRHEATKANRTYRAIVDALPDCLNVKDLDGRFLAANPATATLMRAESATALIGRTDFDFYPADAARKFRQDEVAVLTEGRTRTIEQELAWPAGGSTWLATLKQPLRDQAGAIVGIISHNRDITDQKRLQGEFDESQRRLSYALAQMADGLAMFDVEGRLVFCNEQYRTFFPLTGDLRVAGALFRDILRAVVERGEQIGAPQDRSEDWIDDIVASLHVAGEEEIHLFDGRWLHARTRPSDDGAAMVVVSDVTRHKLAETELLALTGKLKLLATTDGLTGLMNRRAFDQALDTELARSTRLKTPISLLLVDIDRFKAFNDHYGHPAGDQCLRVVSQCLRQTLKRPTDIVARYGGEEFVVILPETTEDGAFFIAEAFRTALRDLALPHDGSEKRVVTASVGVASYAAGERLRPSADLIARADEALYLAKSAGRDRVTGWRRRYHVGIAAGSR